MCGPSVADELKARMRGKHGEPWSFKTVVTEGKDIFMLRTGAWDWGFVVAIQYCHWLAMWKRLLLGFYLLNYFGKGELFW